MGRRCCFCNVPQALEPLRIAEGLTAPGPGAICEDCAQFSVKVFEIARCPRSSGLARKTVGACCNKCAALVWEMVRSKGEPEWAPTERPT